MADLLFPARWRVTDANDNPVSGALALFYDTGTTNLRTVYSDAAGTVPHASPLVADANGVFPTVFATGGTGVKVVVTTSAGVALYTADPVVKTPTTATAATISFTPSVGIPETDVQAAIENVRDQLPSAGVSAFARTLLDDADAAAARTTLGAQASDATLTSLSGLSLVAGDILYATGADTFVRLPKGTAGQVLVMNSGETAPSWSGSAPGSAPVYGCRAWVNFNGTGTPAIRASGNVSSITDNGTGDYTVNFTTAMPDANYAAVVTGREDTSGGQNGAAYAALRRVAGGMSTGSVRITTGEGGVSVDFETVNVAIFR